jgi:pseudaminic acid synthase
LTQQFIEIAKRRIGPGNPPYVIAEMSANHRGSIESALDLMTAAKQAGADAVKLQTYTADTITIDHDSPEFRIKGGLWDGYKLYDLYREAHTPYEWHPQLFAHGRKLGLQVFSTPFDETAVDLLESLDAPAFKIASFEAIDLPLIRRVARAGKPMIISTGMASLDEIGRAVKSAREAGCSQLALLHCISAYPAPAADYNLATIADLAKRFDVVAGLSDHTLGIAVPIAAAAVGASLIEKHFTDARANGGPDSAFSLEPDELRDMCESVRTAFVALGRPNYERTTTEKAMTLFRRSLYVVEDVAKGELFTVRNVRSIRPGYGLAPDRIGDLIGRPAPRDVKRGTPVSEELVPRK